MSRREFSVYVIRLSDRVLDESRFRRANQQYVLGKNCYYVGSTAHEPEVRFRQHRAGGKTANEYAHKYGKFLTPRHYKNLNPLETREEAIKVEEQVAGRLRRRGHAVWQK